MGIYVVKMSEEDGDKLQKQLDDLLDFLPEEEQKGYSQIIDLIHTLQQPAYEEEQESFIV
ncbi:hypothetical protein Metev_0634 [Methanohalobium evestigatum Z-7303]|uniref:Uncharacterized protein n=1 Tax=Methanohalobium evestigatum (strain ATCC BAA-1072 / DSM 3721 / NBRC 107634 / OCM 161 / Z-7303) TaxID=644295 RepID=D7E8J8_METEZ|nr:hypothetical protein [Methanohalobium evestigatum]ADI73540.1 hypothetical protein Metev_0634 [Methanohalobium evestigatum Z-7303]